jgi:hypothetical protein
MRITDVDMYSANFEEPISFSLRHTATKDQYMVRTILGLDAMDIAPKFYGWAINGESKFYDFSLKPRDIVIRATLNPRFNLDESYSDIRDELYRTISSNRTGQVVLHFRSGATTVSRIFGSIIKFEVPYFVELPEVQITIRCNDLMFRALNPVMFTPGDLSFMQDWDTLVLPDSLSTSPHGFTINVHFTAVSASFTIQDAVTNPMWKFKIIPSGGFLVGDALHISAITLTSMPTSFVVEQLFN